MTGPTQPGTTAACEHNLIPCSKWFRSGWVCVRCHQWFRRQPPIDYLAAMNEARIVKLDFDRFARRAKEATQAGDPASALRYMTQAEAAEDRLAEIARYVTRTT
jgi:hypothetical protein